MFRKYNDISNWEWTSLLRVLGDADEKLSVSYTVRTKAELSALLDDKVFAEGDEKMKLVEVIMDKFDAPRALKMQAELSGKTNKYVG
jgi:pyruvate decarboxylase